MPKNVLTPLVERFWPKVNKTEECWWWNGSVSGRYGHGEIGVGRRGEGNLKAHRVSWEIHFGPIPLGMQVLHYCDNGLCVRPDHLFLGDQKENMRDMVSKGRDRNQNTDKQYCKRGHPLFGENLYLVPGKGFRQCRICRANRDRIYKERRKIKICVSE